MDEYLKTKSLLMGALLGAAVLGFVGFNFLNWKTGGKADAQAKQEASGAVAAAFAQICVVQFNGSKDASASLAKLQATDKWSRGDVVAKGGWATMQGAKEPVSGVPQACADLLLPEKKV
jgi:hypothetical protein